MLLFIAITFMVYEKAHCQNQRTVNWYFGKGAALSFSNCEPFILTDCSIYEVNSTATMSDEHGHLLYYIDNHRVTNKNHEPMTNGNDIDFYNWNVSQAIISIPMPGQPDKYLAFTIGDEKRAKLLCHEIDMSDGLGLVTRKNNQIFNLDVTMRMTAVNHANGEDVWLMVQGLGNGKYYAFLITKEGVAKEPVVSDFGIYDVGIYEYGPMKFSSDGSMLVSADYDSNHYNLLFYRFNNETGQLYDQVIENLGSKTPQGVEFSPNNQLIYVSSRTGVCSPGMSYLYQYDVSQWSYSIASGPVNIKSSSENYSFLQLAINGKIYMGGRTSGCDENPYLHVINSPNNEGVDCDFEENAIHLGGKFVWDGLCNFNQSYFANILPQLPDTINICPNENIKITPGKFNSYLWNTGQTEPEIDVSQDGEYSVNVMSSVGCSASADTYVKTRKTPPSKLDSSVSICPNDTITITPGEFDSYLWNTGQTDAQINVSEPGRYIVNFVDSNGCIITDSIDISFLGFPSLSLDDTLDICENDWATIDAGSFVSYLWNTQQNTREITTNQEGWYSVQVSNEYGCKEIDSTFLAVHSLPTLKIEDFFVTEVDTIVVNPGSFHRYLWSDGSTDSTLKIIADDLPLGENSFWVEVQSIYSCISEQDFVVNVLPAERPVKNEILLAVGVNKLSVFNKSAVNKNHEIIIYSLDGHILHKEKIQANSMIEIPITHKGYVIIVLKSTKDRFVKKIFIN